MQPNTTTKIQKIPGGGALGPLSAGVFGKSGPTRGATMGIVIPHKTPKTPRGKRPSPSRATSRRPGSARAPGPDRGRPSSAPFHGGFQAPYPGGAPAPYA